MGPVVLREQRPASELPEGTAWAAPAFPSAVFPPITLRNAEDLRPLPAPGSLERVLGLVDAAISTPAAFGCLLDAPRGIILATRGLPEAGRISSGDWQALAELPAMEATADASQHPWLSGHPLISQLGGMRFYASAPVRDSEGRHWGVLAALSPEPASAGALSRACTHLQSLAEMLGAQLESAAWRQEARQQSLALRAARADAERVVERHRRHLQDLENTIRVMDHRIRTGLQMVNDMLCLQSLSAEDERLAARLTSAAGRIQALAEVHTLLQQAPAQRRVDARAYLGRVLGTFRGRCEDSGRSITLCDGPRIMLSTLDAPRLGIVAWELLANAMRHGQGDVTLELCLEDGGSRLQVLVGDEGPGPAPGVLRDLQSSGRCDSGLHLIRLVAGGEATVMRPGAPTQIGITLDLRQEG